MNILKKIILKNILLLRIYNKFQRFNNRDFYFKEVLLRSKHKLFEYESLAKPLPYYPLNLHKDSNYYGILKTLQEYCGYNFQNSSFLEHGLFLGNYISKNVTYPTVQKILTFSETRKNHLINRGVNKEIYSIGPYIHYAEPLLSEKEHNRVKEKIGKTMLFFPSHSIKDFNVQYDIERQCELLENIRQKYSFKTIMVCAFYKDINDNLEVVKYYSNRGYKIVTAGHIFDYNFLPRLKSIISLADFTISNSIGTHIGYCLYMNKGHYITNIELKRYKENNTTASIDYRTKRELDTLNQERDLLLESFSELNLSPTRDQLKIVGSFWGFGEIKSKRELKFILNPQE